jgi:serine/threonine protein kinase
MLSLEREAVEERYLFPRQGPLVSLGFLPDSKKAFSVTAEKLSLWEGQKREDYSVASGDKIRLARSQGGYILLGTEQGVLHVYHKEGRCFNLGSPIVGIDLHGVEVLALDVNGSLHLTSLHTHKTSSYPLLKGPLSEVLLFAYLPQKEMLVVGLKGTLHRFRRDGEVWTALKEFSFLRGARYALAADGLLLEGGARCLSMWNLDTGSPIEDDREVSQPVGPLTSQGELSLLACTETRHLFAYSSGGKEVTISSIELPPVSLEIDPTIPPILYHEMANLTKIEGASGNFGQIYRGSWNRMPIAFKQLGIPVEGKQKQRQNFAHEVRMMWELRGHPNFSTLYGYCLEPLGLVMLFEEGGTLKKQIESTPPLSMAQKYLFALDVASGLAELHRRGAIHADLKSENVLVGKDKRGKLADFGLAHVSSYKAGHTVAPGDVFWQAPEVVSQLGLKDTVTYTKAADIYSLGLVLYHLFTGKIPFDSHAWTLRDFIPQLTSGLRPPLPDLPVQALIQACWQADAHKRPSIEEVKRQLETLMGPAVSSTQATAKIKESFFSALRMNPLVAQALAYYVPLMATPSYREGTPEDLEKQIETFLSGPKRLLLIQGDSGGGKSTFMQHLAQKLWGGSGRVPLLIELKAISLTSDNFFEATLKEQYGLSDADLEELRQKETVILLDGFDEKPGKPCNLFATNQLKRWNCKVVISCRQEFLINQSYHPWFVVDREFYKECQETFVAPFSWDQVGGYLDRVCLTVHPWSRTQYEEALFWVAGLLEKRIGTTHLGDYGLALAWPRLCWFTLFFVLSSVALPGLNNFVGEILILLGLLKANLALAALLTTSVILGAIYMLRFMQKLYFGPAGAVTGEDIGFKEMALLFPLVVLILLIGLYPQPFLEFIEPILRTSP